MPRLTLLLPESRVLADAPLPPPLAKILGRANREVVAPGRPAQLSRNFRLLPDRWSDAALTRAADAGLADAAGNAWLRADPAWIRPDINGARLMATGEAIGVTLQAGQNIEADLTSDTAGSVYAVPRDPALLYIIDTSSQLAAQFFELPQ